MWWRNDKCFIVNFLLNPKMKDSENGKHLAKVVNEKYCWSFLTHSVVESGCKDNGEIQLENE